MSTTETVTLSKAKVIPKLVVLPKALKLAESWVNNMSGLATDESTEIEFEGRQPRLGLGAKVVHQFRVGASTDPVERKLLAKLNAQKRKAAISSEESNPSERNVGSTEDSDDSDDDPESRTKAFAKKRAISMFPSLHANKKN